MQSKPKASLPSLLFWGILSTVWRLTHLLVTAALAVPRLHAADVNLASYGTASASSEEKTKGNLCQHAHDGDARTRWCANGPAAGSWWALDLGVVVTVSSIRVVWEMPEAVYSYRVESSQDGKRWSTVAEGTCTGEAKLSRTTKLRHVRIVHRNPTSKVWSSLREVEVMGQP